MKRLNDRDFVRSWNLAESLEEFTKVTGYAYQSASSKASYLRKKGYTLKKRYFSPEYYASIGRRGGKKGTTGGFYADRDLARTAGAKGGSISRRIK